MRLEAIRVIRPSTVTNTLGRCLEWPRGWLERTADFMLG